MKITHNKVGQNLNLTDAGKTEKTAEKAKAGSVLNSSTSDVKELNQDSVKVDFSSRAQDTKRIKEIAIAAPDVDQSKVDKFQKLIDAGQYKVNAKAVADRLVDEHLFSTQSSSND